MKSSNLPLSSSVKKGVISRWSVWVVTDTSQQVVQVLVFPSESVTVRSSDLVSVWQQSASMVNNPDAALNCSQQVEKLPDPVKVSSSPMSQLLQHPSTRQMTYEAKKMRREMPVLSPILIAKATMAPIMRKIVAMRDLQCPWLYLPCNLFGGSYPWEGFKQVGANKFFTLGLGCQCTGNL